MPGFALKTFLAALLGWSLACAAQTTTTSMPPPMPAASGAAGGDPALPTPVPTRAEAIDLLKQACPRRAERLLNMAAPEARDDPTVVPGICRCADARLEGSPTSTALDELPELAASDTLACTQPYATANNQALTRQRFADHLLLQGWDERQMDDFSRCLAEGHWQGHVMGLLQGRPNRLKGSVLWADCAAQVGRPGTPLPPARPAAAAPAPAVPAVPAVQMPTPPTLASPPSSPRSDAPSR